MRDEFTTWMDNTGASVDEIAAHFGTKPKTIYNWRSAGITEKKHDWLRTMMANYKPGLKLTDRPFAVEATKEQFNAWEDAAFAARKKLTDWAIDSLDGAAAEAQKRGELPLTILPEEVPSTKIIYTQQGGEDGNDDAASPGEGEDDFLKVAEP